MKKPETRYMIEVFTRGAWATYFNDIGDTYPTLKEATQVAKEIKAEGMSCRILKCIRRFSVHRVLAK
jgi:hypothetical protein